MTTKGELDKRQLQRAGLIYGRVQAEQAEQAEAYSFKTDLENKLIAFLILKENWDK